MKPYTYWLINLLTISVCFIFSFDRKIQFNKHFQAFIKSSILVAIPFIAWDVWFTAHHVWWFNTSHFHVCLFIFAWTNSSIFPG